MAISDILKQLGMIGAQGGQALGNAMQAQGNPLAFQEQQTNQRQQAQQAQQQQEFQQQMAQQLQFHQETMGQGRELRDEANRKWLMDQTQAGTILPAQPGEEGGFSVAGGHYKPAPVRYMTPTPGLSPILGTNPIPINASTAHLLPLFADEIKNLGKNKLTNPDGYYKQLDTLFPTQGDDLTPQELDANKKYNNIYRGQVAALAANNDETGIRTMMNKITEQERDADLAVKKDAQIKDQDDVIAMKNAIRDLPDSTLEYKWEQVKKGAVPAQDMEKSLGITDRAGRRRLANFLADRGDPYPIALAPAAQNALRSMEPVLDSLKILKAALLPYKDHTTPGEFMFDRAKYGLGMGVPDGGLISLGEMDRLRGAAQSMQGIRSTQQVLEQAEIHTPNFWKDSGKLMNDKVDNMIKYLTNSVNTTYKYGAKSGVVQPKRAQSFTSVPQPTIDFGTPPPPPQ